MNNINFVTTTTIGKAWLRRRLRTATEHVALAAMSVNADIDAANPAGAKKTLTRLVTQLERDLNKLYDEIMKP